MNNCWMANKAMQLTAPRSVSLLCVATTFNLQRRALTGAVADLVAVVIVLSDSIATLLTLRLDPVRNAEWAFGIIGTIYMTVIGWICFSVGYAARLLARKWI